MRSRPSASHRWPVLEAARRLLAALRTSAQPPARSATALQRASPTARKNDRTAATLARAPIDFYQLNVAGAHIHTANAAMKIGATAESSVGRSACPAESATSTDPVFALAPADRSAPIGFSLKRSARRSIGLAVRAGALLVSAPNWATPAQIDAALQQHADWICNKLDQARHVQALPGAAAAGSNWRNGAVIAYHGRQLRLRLEPAAGVPGSTRLVQADTASACGPALHERLDAAAAPSADMVADVAAESIGLLCVALPADAPAAAIRDAVRQFLRARAQTQCIARLDHYAARLGVRWCRLNLSDAATRWGSASANGSIRLHWRLIQLAPELLDYVVVHELAHLRQMNHSPRFWAVVADVLPDYAVLRKRLKGLTLPPWE